MGIVSTIVAWQAGYGAATIYRGLKNIIRKAGSGEMIVSS